MVYSFPFAFNPIYEAFRAVPAEVDEQAQLLGATVIDRLGSVYLGQAQASLWVAALMAFAHTLGEFGVVLMVGGSLASETKVASIAIYEAVAKLDYAQAHKLSLTLVLVGASVLFLVTVVRSRS